MSKISQTTQPSTRRRNAATMFPLIEAYLNGHISRSAFCEKHHLSIETFKYWQKKYKNAQKGKDAATTSSSKSKRELFVALHVAPTSSKEQTTCELIFPNGVRLLFSQPVTAPFLLQLIQKGA